MNTIIEQLSVKHARQASKAIAKGSPNYTQMLKQRGYTDEFLVELLDAVELIEPGLLERLKLFYEFRKKYKTTDVILKENFEVLLKKIISLKEDSNNTFRIEFIQYYYLFKIIYIARTQQIKNHITETNIFIHRNNRIELDRLLHDYLEQKHLVDSQHNNFNRIGKNHYHFSTTFVESINTLSRDLSSLYDTIIEKYREAIRAYDAREAAEKEALKEKQATKRLIKRVNKAAAERERASAAAASNRPESARDLRARLRSQRGENS